MVEMISQPRHARLDPLSRVWRFLAAPPTLMVMLGLLALAVLLATVIPQIPSHAADDPQAWLVVQPGFAGQWGVLVRALVLYDVFHTFWFQLILALTSLTLFVRMVEALDLAWRALRGGPWTPEALVTWWRSPRTSRLVSPWHLEEIEDRLDGFLAQHGFRSTSVPGLPVPTRVASQRPLTLWAEPVLYGALLAALVGQGIVATWGWQSPDWQLAPGESRAVGYGTDLAVQLDSFDLRQDEGRGTGPQSEITFLEDGASVGSGRLGMGKPAVHRGVAVRQIGFVPVVKMSGQDGAGHPLAFQVGGQDMGASTEKEIVFPSPNARPVVLIAGHERFLTLGFEPGAAGEQPALEVFEVEVSAKAPNGAKSMPLAVLNRSGEVETGDLQIGFDLEYRPILRMDRQPGMGLVVAGLTLAILALGLVWLLPPHLLWIAAEARAGDSTTLYVLARPGARGSLWPDRLSIRFQEALDDDA